MRHFLNRQNTLIVMVVVAIIYFCFGTAFTFGYQFKPHDGYYGFLTDAFAHGQLHLGIAPDPHLLKMNYPYDPNQTKLSSTRFFEYFF